MPSGDVGNQDIAAQVEFGSVQKDPTARTASATVERPMELSSQTGCHECMCGSRSWAGEQLAIDNLRYQVTGNPDQVLIGSAT